MPWIRECICKELRICEERRDRENMGKREAAYADGYLQGLIDAGWTCGDCGNTYEAKVEACPNEELDRAQATVRRHRWEARQGGGLT